jgi:hypothetical protein
MGVEGFQPQATNEAPSIPKPSETLSVARTACLLSSRAFEPDLCYGTFLMHRLAALIEFTFVDGDCFAAYPANEN